MEEEEEEKRKGMERRWTVDERVNVCWMRSWASFKHFHVYNPIQSQHIQYYIGDPSLLSYKRDITITIR
jgi:hypothetical protein